MEPGIYEACGTCDTEGCDDCGYLGVVPHECAPEGLLSWSARNTEAPPLTRHLLMRTINVDVPRAGAPRGVNHVISPSEDA